MVDFKGEIRTSKAHSIKFDFRKIRSCYGLLIFVFFAFNSFAIAQQQSRDSYTGIWENSTSWSPVWAAPVKTGINFDITINGNITAATDVEFSGSGGDLIVNDTLIINGNLTLGNNNNITVNNAGVLIIKGNLTVDNQVDISANAYIIVTGNFTKTGSDNQGSFTSDDTPSKVFIGGTITYPGTWAETGSGIFNCTGPLEYAGSNCNYGNSADLFTDPISTFVSSLYKTYYSFKTGSWTDPTTWTSDPGGTTQVGTTIPANGDNVFILTGRTVSLSSDIAENNLKITINDGGFLDLGAYRFSSSLTSLQGKGTLRIASSYFPIVPAITNGIVNPGGGTVEYYNPVNFNLPSQAVYNNLSIDKPGAAAVMVNHLTLNGNLSVKGGTFQINNNTAQRLRLTINGDVTVYASANITVGNGVTNTAINHASATGQTGEFLNYYENQSHRIIVNGNFANNGSVRFTNLNYPVYNAFPPTTVGATTGVATVYFRGATNNVLTCNGRTDFYNLILDKGIDQTYKLTVQSSAYQNFRIFGANIYGGENGGANPGLKKALWLKTGTMVLKGLVVIPSLTEGAGGGNPVSNFVIPANGALVLDGPDVIVLVTADDYGEVNRAYNVAGGTGIVNGVNVGANPQALMVYGQLQVNDGYLSTRESGGILYSNVSSGQIDINGGIVDAKQICEPTGSLSGTSFSQSGGLFILRGRLVRPVAYSSMTDLAQTTLTYTTRSTTGINATRGTFNINNASNILTINGGTVRIYDVCGTTAPVYAANIQSSAANTNITGGTFEFLPTHTATGDVATQLINSLAPFGNIVINRGSGNTTDIQLNTNHLTVLKNLSVVSGSLLANVFNVTVGGNFSVLADGTYNSGSNTTTFNGSSSQSFRIDGVIDNGTPGLNNLVVEKPAGTLNVAGTQLSLNVNGSLTLNNGIFDDGGKTIFVTGNIANSATHISIPGTGRIQLNGTNVQTISGDGDGVFQSLELNNTNAAVAPVLLSNNITINGTLTFSQDKLFDIRNYNLSFGVNATVAGYGSLRFIRTNGLAGDGGITKAYGASSSTFLFPVGSPSSNHANAEYAPATISVGGTPATWGTISVNPVGTEHPNTTSKNRSLTYYWHVKSGGGLSLGAANVAHSYTYSQNDVVAPSGDISEDGFVAARYDYGTFTWTKGTTSDIEYATDNIIGEPGSGSFLENVAFIDGDYTAGDDDATDPFGLPRKFFSRINGNGGGSGLWSVAANWSFTSNDGPANTAGAVPGANDIVIIGGRDSIYLATNVTTANTDVRSCATLQIERGAALDIGYNPGCNFTTVVSHSSGLNGNFRLTCDRGPLDGSTVRTFQFPSGNFNDFNQNLGTTELYTTNNVSGTTFYLPNGVTSYGNLIISPLGGSNIIFPNNDLILYGNLITRGQNADSWFCPSWNVNYPTAPATRVAKTITVRGNLDIQGGGLVWYGNGTIAQNVVVHGDVIVSPNSCIDVWSGATSQSMSIGGSLINNTVGTTAGGTSTPRRCDFTLLPLTFFGNSNSSITNTVNNPVTIIDRLTVNKGNSQATSLTINVGGTLTFVNTNNWLTIQNGTLRYERTGDFPVTTTSSFTIPSSAGLYINTPSDVNIANSNSNTNDLFLNGKLTIVNGRVFIGRETGADNNNNDIEYSGGGFSEIDIRGGTLFVNGQIRRNLSTTDGVLKYSQSGNSNVIINGQNRGGASANSALLEVFNAGSSFSMSGISTLTIVRGGGGNTYGDLYLRPENGNVTGGTIIFTQTPSLGAIADADQTYQIDATLPLQNFIISGIAATRNATVKLMVNPLILNGDLSLENENSILDANSNFNINVTINGNFSNNGVYNHFKNTTYFSGGIQEITGTSVIDYYNLTVNPVTNLSINKNATIHNNLVMSRGTFICDTYRATVNGNVTNNASYTENNGGLVLSGGTAEHIISGTGTYGQLELNDPLGARTENDITLQRNLVMSQGILDINQNLLTLGENSNIAGSGFGTTKMITSDGVLSNRGLCKVFGISGGGTFHYPIGTTGKYTPAFLNIINNGSVGTIRINNINRAHLSVFDPSNVLKYYWETESTGITNFEGSVTFYYSPDDVAGGPETNYIAARLLVPGTNWSKAAPGAGTDNVNETNHTIFFNFPTGTTNVSGEYTAGNDDAIPDNIPEFASNKIGNWNDPGIWTQVGGDPYTLTTGPSGVVVHINHKVTINTDNSFAYKTNINDTLQIVAPTWGHNLGSVEGTGLLYLQDGNLPAGRFDKFFDCSLGGGTIEYGGSGNYVLIADRLSTIPKVIFSGTGTRTLPMKDLTICQQFLIKGPDVDNSIYNQRLTILGVMQRTSGQFLAGSGTNATVSFSGIAPQTIADFSGASTFNNLEINNDAGLTLNSMVELKGNLLLNNGLINTSSANILRITNTSVNCVFPSGGSATSYVAGPLSKSLNQGDTYFRFPVGNNSQDGNKFSLRATQTGTMDWIVEYVAPHLLSSFEAPLTAVNEQEYWIVKAPAGSQAYVNIQWDPKSNLTPLMTQFGLTDMRIAEYDGAKWIGLNSWAAGDNYNGFAETFSKVVIDGDGANQYTIACVNTPKPRIRLASVVPVCGKAGIPVTLSTAYTVFGPFTVKYKYNTEDRTINPASFPFTLPTDSVGGVYQLTGFEYNFPAGSPHTGVWDVTPVTTYTVPKVATSGPDQSLCGATTAILAGNNPDSFAGMWSVVSGTGGTVSTPTIYNSNFNGTNGSTYTLRWTISSGNCHSHDDVTITFPLLAKQPLAFVTSDNVLCRGATGVIYTVPNDPSVTYNWTYSGMGAAIHGATNSVTVDYSTSATSGTIAVTATNGCGTSVARTLDVTLNSLPVAAINVVESSGSANNDGIICTGDAVSLTASGGLAYTWSSGQLIQNINVSPVANTTYTVTVTDINGCSDTENQVITVVQIPNTGKFYRRPNN